MSNGARDEDGIYLESGTALTQMELDFVLHYLKSFNGYKSALAAGYSPKNAKVQAVELLKRPRIIAALSDYSQRIKEINAERTETALMDAAEAERELDKICRFNMADVVDDIGYLKPFNELTRDVMACVSEVQVDEITLGTQQIGKRRRIKIFDKKGALELKMKRLKMFSDEDSGKYMMVNFIVHPPKSKAEDG
jgi:phage terminase small subunit